MKLKGIIFDIDGTLTSTNQLIFKSFNHVANKYLNKTFSDQELVSFFGPTEDVLLKDWCPDNYEEARKDYYEFYTANHHLADLYPGILNIIQYIKDKNVLLSIYTGKGKEAATITLKKLDIFKYFDLIITGDDVAEHKPSPEGVSLFLEKFNLAKEDVIIIGDAPADVKAAKASGIKSVSVVWDSYAKDVVLTLGSDYVFESTAELMTFIKESI